LIHHEFPTFRRCLARNSVFRLNNDIKKPPFAEKQNKLLFVQPFPAHTGLRYQGIEQPFQVWGAP
jgi:hypothetical protein